MAAAAEKAKQRRGAPRGSDDDREASDDDAARRPPDPGSDSSEDERPNRNTGGYQLGLLGVLMLVVFVAARQLWQRWKETLRLPGRGNSFEGNRQQRGAVLPP